MQPTLIDKIKATQGGDPHLLKIMEEVHSRSRLEFNISNDGFLRFGRELLEETQRWPYMVHPGSSKMFRDLQEINLLVEKHENGNSSIFGKMFYLASQSGT